MSLRHAGLTLCGAAMLAGCGTTAPQQTTLIAAATPLVANLAGVAAANNTTVAKIVSGGGLFCKQIASLSILTPVVVSLANADGLPVSVTNATAAAVADTCAVVNAIPVPPPANPEKAPVIVVPTTVLPPVA